MRLTDISVIPTKTNLHEKALDELTPDVIKQLQKKITEGAKDTSQKWANALELVQKAYSVVGVQRPTPDMRTAWDQYEDMIAFAVKQLAKFRGVDADWRSTTVETPSESL